MGAALRPLEQENDLKEGLINTSYMIQGAGDRMLKWGGEHTAQGEHENEWGGGGGDGKGGRWHANFYFRGLKSEMCF